MVEAIRAVGLADRATHKPNELSGGQRQRVAIARALVNQPSLILADEPTGNLDSTTSDEIMEILGGLNGAGHTIVLVTHEPDIAARCRRIVRLADGRVVSDQAVIPAGDRRRPAELPAQVRPNLNSGLTLELSPGIQPIPSPCVLGPPVAAAAADRGAGCREPGPGRLRGMDGCTSSTSFPWAWTAPRADARC